MSIIGLTMSGPKSAVLAFDEHGVIKVIKVGVKIPGVAYVVETWGDPDPSKSVAAASSVDIWMCFNRFVKWFFFFFVNFRNYWLSLEKMTEFHHLFSGEINFTKPKFNKHVAGIYLFHKDNPESSFRHNLSTLVRVQVELFADQETFEMLVSKFWLFPVPTKHVTGYLDRLSYLSIRKLSKCWEKNVHFSSVTTEVILTGLSVGSYLSVIGWSMWFPGFIILERNWAKDEDTMRGLCLLKKSLEQLKLGVKLSSAGMHVP
ncbi:hypothetical protein OROMI_023884 [Orobanche minor]